MAARKAAPKQGAADPKRNADRVEEYDATKPDGSTVRVWHNLETGETRIVR